MTTLFSGTDLASIELPNGVTGFGAAEVAYLLSRHEGDVVAKSRSLLQAEDERIDDFVRACGASSLLARGMAAIDSGTIETRSAAALLEFAIMLTRRWTVLRRTDPSSVDIVVVFQAPDTIVIAQPRSFGTWFTSYSDDLDRPGHLVLKLLQDLDAIEPGSQLSVTTATVDGPDSDLLVRLDRASARWDVRSESAEAEGAESALLDDLGLLGRLNQLIRPVRADSDDFSGL